MDPFISSGFFRCKGTQLSRTSSRQSSFTDPEEREKEKGRDGNWGRQRREYGRKEGKKRGRGNGERKKIERSWWWGGGEEGRQVGRVTPRDSLAAPSLYWFDVSNLLATYRARQFLRETPPDGEVDPRVTSNLSIFPRVTKSVKLRRREKVVIHVFQEYMYFPLRKYRFRNARTQFFKKSHYDRGEGMYKLLLKLFLWLAIRGMVLILDGKF